MTFSRELAIKARRFDFETTTLGQNHLIFITTTITKVFKILEDPKIKLQIDRTIKKGLKLYLTAIIHLQNLLLKIFPQRGSREL